MQQLTATEDRDISGDVQLPEIESSLPASHETHLAEFHADRAGGYAGSIYEWHKEKFGKFW